MGNNSINSDKTRESRERKLLNDMARTDIYRINSFRVLNVPISATAKDISAQMRKLELMEKYGNNNANYNYILPVIPSPTSEDRRTAVSRINDPETRLIDELLWFWPQQHNISVEQDSAFTALEKKDIETALGIWRKREVEGSIANVSMHNIAVLYHLLALDLENRHQERTLNKQEIGLKNEYWNTAYDRWRILLNYEPFWKYLNERIKKYDDPRLTTGTIYSIREVLPKALLSINTSLAITASKRGDMNEVYFHTGLIRNSGYGENIFDEVIVKGIMPTYDQIKIICQESGNIINKSPKDGIKLAKQTLNQTSLLLTAIDSLLTTDHYLFKAAHDEIASFALNSIRIYARETEDWSLALQVCHEAEKIAAGQVIKQRILEDIDGINAALQYNLDYANCWFCRIRPADENAAYAIKMHGNVERDGNTVRFNHGDIKVPRCKRCKAAHSRIKVFKILFAVIGGLVGLGGCISVEAYEWGIFGLIPIGIGIGIGFGIGVLFGKLTTIGVKTEAYGKKFGPVQKALKEGFMFGEKPSGVQ